MKRRLFFAIVLLVAAFTMPIFAVASGGGAVVGGGTTTLNNCTYTCSSGHVGHAWASNSQACADGCRAMCGSCASAQFTATSNNN
jgi:hypothetical protein